MSLPERADQGVESDAATRPNLRLGIDASNLRGGGGITHLVEFLRHAKPREFGFEALVLWGPRATLYLIEARPWLTLIECPALDRGAMSRAWWQLFQLPRALTSAKCDILFAPGGIASARFRPVVTMSRNLLPFEWREMRRFGLSRTLARYVYLRWRQAKSFRLVDGLIFLSQHAMDVVTSVIRHLPPMTRLIPHGVDERFFAEPRAITPMLGFSDKRPFRLLYVSIVNFYKHQWVVAEAAIRARQAGYPVVLDLVGPANPKALRKLHRALARLDPLGDVVRYRGSVAYSDLPAEYAACDAVIFASTCENMPNILLEAMASARPIACSKSGPMPEVLGACGIYFDAESAFDIERAIRLLFDSASRRAELAAAAAERARSYTWDRSAALTLTFLRDVAISRRSANPRLRSAPIRS